MVQLEGNLNLVKLSLLIYFAGEYHYTLRLIRCLYIFNVRLKKEQIWVTVYIRMEKKGKTHINSKFSG